MQTLVKLPLDIRKISLHNKYVNKIARKILITIIFIVSFTLTFTSSVSAHHKSRVLGASTTSVQLPPTVEGPGLILPDSPLFFLDQLKQSSRVLLSFSPEDKARVYQDIAGERFAELRYMLAKNNKEASRLALLGISDNLQKASDELNQAQFAGKNITELAREINRDIKSKQQSLDLLENQTTGEMEKQAVAAGEALMAAKIKVEEVLPKDELENEIKEDLERMVAKDVENVTTSAQILQEDLEELNKQASDAAKSALTRREEALRKAIAEKNESLKKENERLLEAEKKKQQSLFAVQESAASQTREIVKKAQEAAASFQRTRETTEQVKSQLSLPVQPQTSTAPAQAVAGDTSGKE